MKWSARWMMVCGLMGCMVVPALAVQGIAPTSVSMTRMVFGFQQSRPSNPTVPANQPSQQPPRPRPTQPMLGPPPVEFHPEVLDLGTVRPNDRVFGQVQLQNVSEKWLKIVASRADCTCTSVNLADTLLAPGQSVPLEAQLKTSVMGEWSGAIQVLIEGYDPITVRATAVVALPVHADPPYVAALKDSQGQLPVTGEFTVSSIDGKPFSVLAVNGEPPQFVAELGATKSPRNEYRLKWDLSEFDPKTCRDSTGRRLPGWIIVETDHPDCPIFDLEVRHECNRRQILRTDSWAVQEKRVFIGNVKPGEPVECEVVAKWIPRRNHDPITAVVSESRQFTVELIGTESMDDGMRCRFRLTPAADHRGLLNGTVRLQSARQGNSLPVIGTVR